MTWLLLGTALYLLLGLICFIIYDSIEQNMFPLTAHINRKETIILSTIGSLIWPVTLPVFLSIDSGWRHILPLRFGIMSESKQREAIRKVHGIDIERPRSQFPQR